MAAIPLLPRARYYRTLAELLDANVPPEALADALERGFRRPALRALTERIRASLRSGNPVSDAILGASDLGIPVVHGAILEAAEKSGHLGRQLKRIAAWDEGRQTSIDLARKQAWYPLAVFHLAVLATVSMQILSAPHRAMLLFIGICVPVDVLLFLLYRSLAAPNPGTGVARFVRLVPAVETMIRDREAAAYLGTVGQLYEAGIPILDAARKSLAAIRFDDLKRKYESAVDDAARGHGEFREVVQALPMDRPETLAMIVVAETAGDLSRALTDASHLLDERAGNTAATLTRIASRGFYFAVVIFAVWRILAFYSDYWGQFAKMR